MASNGRSFDLVAELRARQQYKFRQYFPDCLPGCKATSKNPDDHVRRLVHGNDVPFPVCRVLFPRSLLFFAAGKQFRERLFMAANRCSKTESAAYETTAHLTGDYPHWWPGRMFTAPIDAWIAGDTFESTRDVPQLAMCGKRDAIRAGRFAGMIPAHLVLDRTLKSGGVSDCIDTMWIRWGMKDADGVWHPEMVGGAPASSVVAFKTYAQGRLSFQGTSKHLIWLDEEPPDVTEDPGAGGTPSGNGDLYTECLLRTSTTDGLIMATFTPLRGLTPFVDHYLETATMADQSGKLVNAKVGLFGAVTT